MLLNGLFCWICEFFFAGQKLYTCLWCCDEVVVGAPLGRSERWDASIRGPVWGGQGRRCVARPEGGPPQLARSRGARVTCKSEPMDECPSSPELAGSQPPTPQLMAIKRQQASTPDQTDKNNVPANNNNNDVGFVLAEMDDEQEQQDDDDVCIYYTWKKETTVTCAIIEIYQRVCNTIQCFQITYLSIN